MSKEEKEENLPERRGRRRGPNEFYRTCTGKTGPPAPPRISFPSPLRFPFYKLNWNLGTLPNGRDGTAKMQRWVKQKSLFFFLCVFSPPTEETRQIR